MFDLKP